MIANLRHAARNRETVTIGGGLMLRPELLAAAHALECHAAVVDALQWALGQIEDDMDPDHQAALAAAHQALAHARQGQQTNEV